VAQAIGATGGGSDPNAKVGEEITLQAQLYRVPQAEITDRTARLTRQLDLGGLEDRLVKTLSCRDCCGNWTRPGSACSPSSSPARRSMTSSSP
jgi:hypothetical protein